MKLGATILKNEKTGKANLNHRIVNARLKELVSKYPNQITDVLTSQNIKASVTAPKMVLYSVLVKHLALNSELRAAISNILLTEESAEYLNVGGTGMTIAGGALQALGGVLAGIGRNQAFASNVSPKDPETLKREAEERERIRVEAESKRKTNLAIGITAGVLVLVGIVAAVIYFNKKKSIDLKETIPSVKGLN